MHTDVKTYGQYYIKNLIKYSKLKLGLPVNGQFTKQALLDAKQANDTIYDLLLSDDPVMICRFGETEARAVAEWIGIKLGVKKHTAEKRLRRLHENAGVFPYGEEMQQFFAEKMLDSIPEATVLGVWNTFMQDYLIDTFVPSSTHLVPLSGLEPYYFEKPWSRALQGKKVLVIHPFAETIARQYSQHSLLFDNPEMLPDFDLTTMKAVQTIAGTVDPRFSHWGEALDFMVQQALAHDFDIAIIGCGGYGFPLAAALKRAGKKAIHLGGATQILFGIKGARWDHHPIIGNLYNEYWTRPALHEKPENNQKIENGCYW